ncbi:MAG: hypothetical protein QOI17_1841, partial [Gaiellales bacterium]|nr:hypothetical protein [Gaiellales bacterium]
VMQSLLSASVTNLISADVPLF